MDVLRGINSRNGATRTVAVAASSVPGKRSTCVAVIGNREEESSRRET